ADQVIVVEHLPRRFRRGGGARATPTDLTTIRAAAPSNHLRRILGVRSDEEATLGAKIEKESGRGEGGGDLSTTTSAPAAPRRIAQGDGAEVPAGKPSVDGRRIRETSALR